MQKNQRYQTAEACEAAIEEHFGLKLRPHVSRSKDTRRAYDLVSPTGMRVFGIEISQFKNEWAVCSHLWNPQYDTE